MLDFTDFLAMMAIDDAHEEYERERKREERQNNQTSYRGSINY